MKHLADSHTPLIAGLTDRPPTGIEALDAQRRRQLLSEISKGGTTRKRLASLLRMRAGTVTQHVAELIDAGLVRELHQIRTNEKGRPEVLLSCATGAVKVIVVQAMADRIVANLVDLEGTSSCEVFRPVRDPGIGGDDFRALIIGLAGELRDRAGADRLAGLVVSLPGIVDEAAGQWLFSSRFPNAAPLAFASVGEALGMDVQVQRALNAELRARLLRSYEGGADSTVLLHWGYGVGLTSAINGAVQHSAQGGFGEIGHWRSFMAGEARCRCGETGCLETQAALWSLVAPLRLPSSSEDEFARHLADDARLSEHPLIRQATTAMAIAMRDVYLLLFPNRITITGPFVQSPAIFERLVHEFHGNLPQYVPANVAVEAAVLSPRDEIIGAAKPLLYQAMQKVLAGI